MAPIVTERITSRSETEGDNPTHTRVFDVRNLGAMDDAITVLLAAEESPGVLYAPALVMGLPRRSVATEPLTTTHSVITANWGISGGSAPVAGDNATEFEISTQSQKIQQSLETVSNTAPAGGTARDFGGAINVSSDLETVNGVDVLVPSGSFSETHYFDDATVTAAYQRAVEDLAGTVNNATFRGRPAGEVLFVGARGRKRDNRTVGSSGWEISFRFLTSKNATNIAVGDITVPAKGGWEALWVFYGKSNDTTASRLVKKPISAHVEKVYPDGNFAGLGI